MFVQANQLPLNVTLGLCTLEEEANKQFGEHETHLTLRDLTIFTE